MHEAIQKLMHLGCCLIPVRFRSKEPLVPGWQLRTAGQNDLSEFEGQVNVGVVLGSASAAPARGS